MKILLSLPHNATKDYHALNHRSEEDWFCTSDPKGKRLGSGSGTTWLLEACCREDNPEADFDLWLSREKRILIHAGGQGRRLPSYAVTGKTGLPVPVFRWARGQRLGQDLVSLQIPLYEKILQQAPDSLRTLIASGDVLIRAEEPLQEIPEADVVCYGLWVDSSQATRHGVFAARRESPEVLDRMMQKPSLQELEGMSQSHFLLMDIGIWLLSDRAVRLLRERSHAEDGSPVFFDLYSDFGLALGSHPKKTDDEINRLSVKILPLPGGEFYHYGTTREMITSTLALQNKVYDQRLIMHRKIKPNPAIFTQNAIIEIPFHAENQNIWIENACLGKGWTVKADSVITGVPRNDWQLNVPKGVCIDMVPVGGGSFALRPYGMDDRFSGKADDLQTLWMGQPVTEWLQQRGLDLAVLRNKTVKEDSILQGKVFDTNPLGKRYFESGDPGGDDLHDALWESVDDLQNCRLFPCLDDLDEAEAVLKWMIGDGFQDAGKFHFGDRSRNLLEVGKNLPEVGQDFPESDKDLCEVGQDLTETDRYWLKVKQCWLMAERLSADELMERASMTRLYAQREDFRRENYKMLEKNFEKSVFYQLDLSDVAEEYHRLGLELPGLLNGSQPNTQFNSPTIPQANNQPSSQSNTPINTQLNTPTISEPILQPNTSQSNSQTISQPNSTTIPQTNNQSSSQPSAMLQIHNRMLRSRLFSLRGETVAADKEEKEAFSLLRNGMIAVLSDKKCSPRLAAYPDQIVWGRSPVRIDLAGGWTDTPPFSLYAGGNVVNIAIELNGQPPLQVYVKPCKEYHFVMRSIDMGASEVISSFEELRAFHQLGSPFSIPKAALALCGFLPEFSAERWGSLEEQLKAFGAGIELTLLAAIPAGSGLGTSSILASTVLGALNDFCGLQWNKQEISTNTLVLEQLLTSGGGWQDQYGGIFHGVKLLESGRGFLQTPQISWLPDFLFTDPAYKPFHLLYYTGITRVAKNILGEIVRGMFLNSAQHLSILHEMKLHAADMANCIQRGDFERYGCLILKTWEQKKMIDSGTNPPEVERIIGLIKDYTLGYKLPGAGGGGYLYMVAKDEEAALRIRKVLNENPLNEKSRFVEMELSRKGFQVSRS